MLRHIVAWGWYLPRFSCAARLSALRRLQAKFWNPPHVIWRRKFCSAGATKPAFSHGAGRRQHNHSIRAEQSRPRTIREHTILRVLPLETPVNSWKEEEWSPMRQA